MATLTIRQLDEKTKSRLRIRAAHHGRSMEEEARDILRTVLTASPLQNTNLADAIHKRFAAFGGINLALPPRGKIRHTPDFQE
jgi:antitoxin FitA